MLRSERSPSSDLGVHDDRNAYPGAGFAWERGGGLGPFRGSRGGQGWPGGVWILPLFFFAERSAGPPPRREGRPGGGGGGPARPGGVQRPSARLLVGYRPVPGGQQLGHQLVTDAVVYGPGCLGRLEASDLRHDVAELRGPIEGRRRFARLLVGVHAVPGGGQQLGHQLVTDAVAHGLECPGQLPHALRGPAQWGVRVPRGGGLDQALQVAQQRWGPCRRCASAPTRPPHRPAATPAPRPQLSESPVIVEVEMPGGLRHQRDAATISAWCFRRPVPED